MNKVEIKPSRKKIIGIVVVTGMFILYYFFGPYEKTRSMYHENPILTYVLGFIFFGVFFFYLRWLIFKPTEISLDDDGIYIRGKGWNHWDDVTYYHGEAELATEDSREKEYLIIRLKDGREIKCI